MVRPRRHIRPHTRPRQPFYWWIVGADEETGKKYVSGPYYTESNGTEMGFRKFSGNFEMYKLDTCDDAAAKSKLKDKLLEETGNISDSMRPMSST